MTRRHFDIQLDRGKTGLQNGYEYTTWVFIFMYLHFTIFKKETYFDNKVGP